MAALGRVAPLGKLGRSWNTYLNIDATTVLHLVGQKLNLLERIVACVQFVHVNELGGVFFEVHQI